MKRILFIAHTASMGGGAEKVLSILIKELSQRYLVDLIERVEDVALPFDIPNKNVRHLPSMSFTDRKCQELGNNVFCNRIWRILLSVWIFVLPRSVHRHFIKDSYDYEVSFNYLYCSSLVGNSPNRNSKKVMWIHGAIVDLLPPITAINGVGGKLKHRAERMMQKDAFFKSDAIVAISQRTHDSIADFCPEVKSKIVDVYNGYDLLIINRLARKFEYPNSRLFRLVSLGRVTCAKNVILQVEAVECLRKKGIDVELLIIGDGDQTDYIQNVSKNNPHIKLLGFKSNPYPYLLASDALIITSLNEGFPTTAVEAMALGKPVISTPVAGTNELINAQTGVLVDWNVASVAAGLEKMIATKWDSRLIASSVSKYSKEAWAENVSNLLESL